MGDFCTIVRWIICHVLTESIGLLSVRATPGSQGKYWVYAEKLAQEPLARILKLTNIAFKRPVIRLTTSLFLKTMLVHNLEEAVASWKARKSSGWLPDGCIMGILLVPFELAPLCQFVGRASAIHFPRGTISYICCILILVAFNLVMVTSSAPPSWRCHMYSFFGSPKFCIHAASLQWNC